MKNKLYKQLDTKALEPYINGVRLLMLTQRSKEGGKINKPDRVAKKRLTRNKQEFIEQFNILKKEKDDSDIPLRIYSSVNARDVEKAIREFKYRQLDADYYDDESRQSFYFDVKNRWISSVMKPNCRAETKFLIDIDKKDYPDLGIDSIDDVVNELDEIENVRKNNVLLYPTKNGWHYITAPFNPANTRFEVKKDALLLLDW